MVEYHWIVLKKKQLQPKKRLKVTKTDVGFGERKNKIWRLKWKV